MKLDKFKRRNRVTLIPSGERTTWKVKDDLRSKARIWCTDRYGLSEEEKWMPASERTWSISWRNRQGLYAYFKNEADAAMFLLGFSRKISVDN